MSRIKTFFVVGAVAAMVAATFAYANVNFFDIKWLSKTSFVVGGMVEGNKPSPDWDTQKTKDINSPYKFVLHRGGANPKCWLRFDDDPSGKTAHAYANGLLKSRFEMRGMKVAKILNRQIAGRNVAFIAAHDVAKGHRYLVGAWRNTARGINLECDVDDANFGVYEPQFRNFIDSVRIRSEY